MNNKGGDSAKPSETCFSVLTRHYDCEAVLLIYRSTTYIDCADRDSQKLHSVDGKTGTALDLSINHRSIVVMTLHKQYTYNQLFSLRQMDWLSFDDVGSRWGAKLHIAFFLVEPFTTGFSWGICTLATIDRLLDEAAYYAKHMHLRCVRKGSTHDCGMFDRCHIFILLIVHSQDRATDYHT